MQITYLEASSYTNEYSYSFLLNYNLDLSYYDKKRFNRDCQKLNKHLLKHKQRFDSNLTLKNARLINFHFANGYALILNGKNLCKNDAIFLGVLHLRKIELVGCLFNLDFCFSFCKSIRFNIERIETFYCYFASDFKSYFIILNVLQFCIKIKSFTFTHGFYESQLPILFPKSFYNFLSSFYALETIYFKNLIFYDDMNLNSFKNLISLQTLRLVGCCFHNKLLLFCLLDNIPNLNKLILLCNEIKGNSFNLNINEENIKLKKTKKFSPILRIENTDNSFGNSIFQYMIQFDKIKMKYIQIDLKKNAPIPNLIDFLKCSNLQYLEIDYLHEVESFNLEEFCNYLRNSQFLFGLKLTSMNIVNSNYFFLLQSISLNKSIKVLSFEASDSSNFSFDMINLILTNQYITTLILYKYYIIIGKEIIEKLSKNKTLQYLDLRINTIIEEDASKLSNLNLKGINVDDSNISQESEEFIYQKIPRKEFAKDLLSYENF